MTSGVPVTQGERVVTTVSQYSITQPFYYEQGQNTFQVSEYIQFINMVPSALILFFFFFFLRNFFC